MLKKLQDEYPEIKNVMFDDDGSLRTFINIYLNDKDVTDTKEWSRETGGNDEILLLPFIAGGAPVESIISDERRKEVKLDNDEIDRFNRHLMLREIGVKGQKRIKASKVLIIGLGALGSPVAQYLAAAGVGTIGLADYDEVSLGNLQSQVIHGKRDVHRPKTASAKDSIRLINPKITINTYNIKVEAENVEEIIQDYDVIADCTDNYKARYLINDACVLSGKTYVSGAIYQYEGRVSVFGAKGGPCLRCEFPAPPPSGLVPTCAEGGTISPLSGIIGSIQANEILKLIIGGGEVLIGKTFHIDTWNLSARILPVHKKENCPVCGGYPTIVSVED